MGALVYKTREARISYLKGLAMWTVLNVLRRWFPVNWPKIENRIRLFLMRRKIAIVWPMRNLDRDRIITCHDPPWDYIRISNLELCAYEIFHNDVAGDVAELGVFKGDFARKINEAFPEKKLYLFDTFEGFDQRDVAIETDRKIDTPDKSFPGSNVDLVMGKMPHPQNVRIQKGYFPDTTTDVEETSFCFVSLDVDLYQPTIEGLKYFYPRLSKGGYIFIHDFHSRYFPGCGIAVREFIKANNVAYVPLSDQGGSVIIVKA